MAFEAARVRRDDRGKELAEYPQSFVDLAEALAYVRETPVSNDGVRPWIRNLSSPRMLGSFLMVGGRLLGPQAALGTLFDGPMSSLPVRAESGGNWR